MSSPPDTPPPDEKKLRVASFAIHATRGLLRDQSARRWTMFGLVCAALGLLSGGATFLGPVLDPRSRPGWFIFYWFVCGWITATAALLAVFDLLLVRAQARAVKRALAEQISAPPKANDAD
jgi:hypothetical protein